MRNWGKRVIIFDFVKSTEGKEAAFAESCKETCVGHQNKDEEEENQTKGTHIFSDKGRRRVKFSEYCEKKKTRKKRSTQLTINH